MMQISWEFSGEDGVCSLRSHHNRLLLSGTFFLKGWGFALVGRLGSLPTIQPFGGVGCCSGIFLVLNYFLLLN